MEKDGQQLVVQVSVTDSPIYVAMWKVAVGRVCLYLMDMDVGSNRPRERAMTDRNAL